MKRFSVVLAILGGLAVASTSLAVPGSFTHQGRLFDSSGAALTGTQSVTITLYDAATSGNVVWTNTEDLEFDNGFFSTQLGDSSNAITADDVDVSELFVTVTVDGSESSPQAVNSVPYALLADTAVNVNGGTVNASEIRVNDTTVVDSSGALQTPVDWSLVENLPSSISTLATGTSLADLSCSDGEVAVFSGSDWACGVALPDTIPVELLDGTISPSNLPIGTGSGDVAAGDHTHANLYTKDEVDAMFAPSSTGKAVPRGWVANGSSRVCHDAEGAGNFSDLADLDLSFDLDGDYIIVAQFHGSMSNNSSGDWVATRLVVDDAADPFATHSQPIGAAGEDHNHHLFRIEELGAGSHNVKVEWGDGGGTICSGVDEVRSRRLSVYAIPKETGVKFGYTHGDDNNACHPASGANWSRVPNMNLDADLDEDSLLVSFFDMNAVGGANDWVATRIGVDGTAQGGTHIQPTSAGEDDQLFFFQFNEVAAGQHTIEGQWGGGSGTMCNNTNDSRKVWDRRLGYVAIPKSTGVAWGYADPRNDASTNSTTWSMPSGMGYEMWLNNGGYDYLALTTSHLNFYTASNNEWSAFRLNIDGNAEFHGVHSQHNGATHDAGNGAHRLDVFSPGSHSVRGEWRANGTAYNQSSNVTYGGNGGEIWSRRIGTFALPVKSFEE